MLVDDRSNNLSNLVLYLFLHIKDRIPSLFTSDNVHRISSRTLPGFVWLVQLFDSHKLLELVSQAFFAFNQSSSWNSSIGTHVLKSQDKLSVLFFNAPYPRHAPYKSDLVLNHFYLLPLIADL